MTRAAFFDMDRTLLRVNTGPLYIRWRFRRGEASLREVARVARWVTLYTLGRIDPEEITRGAAAALRGVDESRFHQEVLHWWTREVRPAISEDARREVEARRARGFLPVILTASTRYATEPLARELGIEHVLCSALEVHRGRFTGGCAYLCYGEGKVRAAESWARANGVDLDASVFYTDSVSDLPMLDRVGEPQVVNPDPRLWWHARRRGWPVRRWR